MSLPAAVERGLRDFIEAAQSAFGANLVSIVLYGSGAEDRLRPTSDVNVIVMLSAFTQREAEQMAPALAVAKAAIRLDAMFLREREIAAAAECFAQKFADVLRRRKALYGSDPFGQIAVPRAALLRRLKQVLLNLTLRLRRAFVERAAYEDQLAVLVAETAGPLRSSAATLLELEGKPAPSPKEALARLVEEWREPDWQRALNHVSEAREKRALAPGLATPTVFALLGMADRMRSRIDELAP